MESVGWIDVLLAVLLALSVVVGLVRGLLFEVMSVLGWVVAYFAAQWLMPLLAPALPLGTPGSALNLAGAFVCAFIAVLVAWGLMAWLLRKLTQASPLSLADRLLGGVFGFARGVLIGLLMVTLVGFTPIAKARLWQGSHGVAMLAAVLAGLRPLLPEEFARHVALNAGGARVSNLNVVVG